MSAPRNRSYATFDPNAMGPGLILDPSLMQVTTYLNSLDFNRLLLLTQPRAVGDHFIELQVWSNAQAGLANMVSIGVIRTDHPTTSMTTYIGGDSFGYGYRLGEGAVYNNNAQVGGTLTVPQDERQTYGIYLHLSVPGSESAWWFRNGIQIAVASLVASKFYAFGVSLASGVVASGALAGDIKISLNTGIDGFDNQPSPIV